MQKQAGYKLCRSVGLQEVLVGSTKRRHRPLLPGAFMLISGKCQSGGCALKMYVATIMVYDSQYDNRPVGRNDLVIKFLKGMRWLNPPRSSMY